MHVIRPATTNFLNHILANVTHPLTLTIALYILVAPTWQQQLLLPLVLFLRAASHLHGAAGLQEGLPLRPVREVLSVHPGEVDGHVQRHVGQHGGQQILIGLAKKRKNVKLRVKRRWGTVMNSEIRLASCRKGKKGGERKERIRNLRVSEKEKKVELKWEKAIHVIITIHYNNTQRENKTWLPS